MVLEVLNICRKETVASYLIEAEVLNLFEVHVTPDLELEIYQVPIHLQIQKAIKI